MGPLTDLTRERRLSLRWRLTLWVLGIFVLIQGVTSAAFWLHQRSSIRAAFDERMLEAVERLHEVFGYRPLRASRSELQFAAYREFGFVQPDPMFIGLIGAGAREDAGMPLGLAESARALAERAAAARRTVRQTVAAPASFDLGDGRRLEGVGVPVLSGGEAEALVVLTSDGVIVRRMALIERVLVVGGLFGVLAAGVSGWLIAGIAVEPIRQLSDVAGRLGPETLDEALVVRANDAEVAALTQELDAARDRLRAAFAAQERFLSNVSHELKTPIATLLTQAQTIDRSRMPAEGDGFVETVEAEMRKLGGLVESFLTLTRVRDGAGAAALRHCPANELVMDAVEDCAAMAEQYGVRLEPRLAGEDEALDARLLGEPDLLRTMFNNLIRNAIRFSPRDAGVRVVASIDADRFVVSVQDAGPGLHPDLIDVIFDEFVRGPDEVRRERGHGLGLAIAKGVAELHGADISARNLTGRGAEFAVRLPLAAAEAAARGAVESSPLRSAERDGR